MYDRFLAERGARPAYRPARRFAAGAVVAFLMTAFGGVDAGAQRLADRGSADDQRACTPDVFRLCAGSIPNEPRIVACLIRSRPRLSPACRAVFDRDAAARRPRGKQRMAHPHTRGRPAKVKVAKTAKPAGGQGHKAKTPRKTAAPKRQRAAER
jgi:hypothetical protein